MNPKDKSMVCRMAGNIAGQLVHDSTKLNLEYDANFYAKKAVDIAVAIVSIVDSKIETGGW